MSKPRTSRRVFLASLAGGVATAARGAAPPQDAAVEPILDVHQHTLYNGRPDDALLVHQAAHKIRTTVILPGEGWMLSIIGSNRHCERFVAAHADRFVRFTSSDAAESLTVDLLRGNLDRGALGIGEMKYRVAVDSPEMHRVYKLAEERRVPVLVHFEHETYNTGIQRFEKVLRTYPKVNFLGHAQTWWGNVSADLDSTVLYPAGRVKPGGLTDRLLADYPNMYGDLSAGSGLNALTRDPEFARGFVDRHARKLVWGSDCDCRDGHGGGIRSGFCLAERSLAALRDYLPDRAKLRRILWDNGAALLRLKNVPSRTGA